RRRAPSRSDRRRRLAAVYTASLIPGRLPSSPAESCTCSGKVRQPLFRRGELVYRIGVRRPGVAPPGHARRCDMHDEWDVIVIGAGAAGLSAAVSAAERGASVIIFESEGAIGGSLQLSAGMFTAAGTSVQSKLGIEDSPERFFQHYMDLNQWMLQPGLIWRFCQQAAPTFEWLLSLGVEVPARRSTNAHVPGVCQAGVEDVWRGHVPVGQGFRLVEVLDRARRDHRCDLVLHTRIEKL